VSKSKQAAPAALERLTADRGVTGGQEWMTVGTADLREVMTALKGSGFETLSFLTCVDHLRTVVQPSPPARFELVYQLRSYSHRRLLRVRCFVDGDPPSAPTVSDIFPPADWDERETYDLFGVVFEGHPGLTRILMPDDWVGHPLRRDYPVGGEAVTFSDEHRVWQTAPPEA
jgi:NADH-quinone oxidoreductase subunit C